MYDLHALIRENKVDDIQEAIAKGADINMQDAEGNTPLILALGEEEVKDETIECLLNYNPDVTITNYGGDTSLHLAVIRNNIKLIKALIEKGADINARDRVFQATPLLSIINHRPCDDIEVIKCLLENGADINARNGYGKTVLHQAVEDWGNKYNTLTLIEYLLQNGADINAQDKEGCTPLIKAMYNIARNETHIALLLRYNPDVTIKNDAGRTAVSYMYDRNDLSDSIKGQILSLCLLGDPMMQYLKSEEFQGGFCKNTSLPTELYLDIVDHAKSYILEDIAPEIPLQDKLNWLKAHKEETRRKRQEQVSEAEEQPLPYETRCRA